MRKLEKSRLAIAVVAILSLVLLQSTGSTAQDKPKRETFQAVAMGQAQRSGECSTSTS